MRSPSGDSMKAMQGHQAVWSWMPPPSSFSWNEDVRVRRVSLKGSTSLTRVIVSSFSPSTPNSRTECARLSYNLHKFTHPEGKISSLLRAFTITSLTLGFTSIHHSQFVVEQITRHQCCYLRSVADWQLLHVPAIMLLCVCPMPCDQ